MQDLKVRSAFVSCKANQFAFSRHGRGWFQFSNDCFVLAGRAIMSAPPPPRHSLTLVSSRIKERTLTARDYQFNAND